MAHESAICANGDGIVSPRHRGKTRCVRVCFSERSADRPRPLSSIFDDAREVSSRCSVPSFHLALPHMIQMIALLAPAGRKILGEQEARLGCSENGFA